MLSRLVSRATEAHYSGGTGAAEVAVQRRAAMTPAPPPDVRAAARSAGQAAKQVWLHGPI